MNAPMPPEAATLVASLPLNQIVASPTNPRKHIDDAYIAELAETIKAHGVIQPITVRPNPMDTDGLWPYELVVGECRWRASKLAGLTEIPAFWRELDDKQVLEIQVIENLQRRDVHPLEEAEGYDQLMKKHGYLVEQLADKIGKSKGYIYARLKLLALGNDGRDAMYSSDTVPQPLDASTALLIARIENPTLQKKAVKEIMHNSGRGYPMSYRDAKYYIRNQFTISLKQATFPLTDAELVPEAGSCSSCPKLSGNAPDLFGDITDADVCSDTKCFEGKKLARREQILAQAEANQIPVLRGDAVSPVMERNGYYVKSDAHVRLDETCEGDAEERTYREILGDQAPVDVICEVGMSESNKTIVELATTKALADALTKAGWKPAEGEEGPDFLEEGYEHSETAIAGTSTHVPPQDPEEAERQHEELKQQQAAERAEQRRKQKIATLWRNMMIDHAVSDIRCQSGFDNVTAQLSLLAKFHLRWNVEMVGEDISEIYRRWGQEVAEEYDDGDELEKFLPRLDEMGCNQLLAFLFDLILDEERFNGLAEPKNTLALLAHLGTASPEAIRCAAEAKIAQAEAAEAAANPALTVGTRVRIKPGIKGPGRTHTRKCVGKEGTIDQIEGIAIVVRFGPKKTDLVADLRAEDLEILPAAAAEEPPTPTNAAQAQENIVAEPAAPAKGKSKAKKTKATQDPATASPSEGNETPTGEQAEKGAGEAQAKARPWPFPTGAVE